MAFFVSALIHELGALNISRRDLGELRFFLSQAVAITFEDIVIAAAKKLSYRDGRWVGRVVGYFWVFAWLSYSLRGWVGGGVMGGLWVDRSLEYSVIGKVLELWDVKL